MTIKVSNSRRLESVTSMLVLLASTVPFNVHGKEVESHKSEIIYAATIGKAIDVYDLSRGVVFSEGAEYLSRRDGLHETEFAGRFVDCGTRAFYCIRGGLYAVVPKSIVGQNKWSSHSVRCRSQLPITQRSQNAISCTFKNRTTSFQYDVQRGIVSYKNLVASQPEFVLVGDRGLFGR
jgi:hypothetical protein